jgi:immune inhibitor A
MNRKLWITVLVSLALLANLLAALPAGANPPAPEDPVSGNPPVDVTVGLPAAVPSKAIDQPNPKDYMRLQARQRLLEAGQTAEAAALAQTGTDRVLVILVEFAGTDTFTWHPGDTWDPLGRADPNEYTGTAGDCSRIITQERTFTYTGPLHNQIPRPLSAADRSGDSIWTEDFSPTWFNDFMFGNGVTFHYTRADGSLVHEDFTGESVKNYYLDMSAGQYNVTGDVIGWVQVPHSTWWYGADPCPGRRSGASVSHNGAIPGAGSSRSLVRDALDAVNAIKNTIPGFSWRNYDLNGDGVIDRLWIVHAGYGEEDAVDLLNRTDYGEAANWSHSAALTPAYPVGEGISAGPYIMMPENGGIGVFAHEYAHNLGADDLYSYGGGETSAGFWTLMADDWTGYPIGFEPPAVDSLHLDWWGWLNPVVINDPTQEYIVTLGQASNFPGGAGVYRGAKIQLANGVLPLPAPVWQGNFYWWGGKADLINGMMTTNAAIAIPAGAAATLSFDLAYDIEPAWDFLWIQASEDGGATWRTLTNANTTCTHDPNWIGGLYGFPENLCAAGIGGFTAHSAHFPQPDTQTFDLSAFAGKSILLRFWYMTDWGTTMAGAFVDSVAVKSGDTVLFADDAEAGDANWTYEAPWQRSDGTQQFTHNFYLQWRNVSANGGYDSALGEARWRFGPANTGLLVWYNNNFYSDNEILNYLTDFPGWGPKGRMLVLDSHPEPYRDPYYVTMGYNNEGGNVSHRSQMRDAPFSLQNSVNFTMAPPYTYATTQFSGRPAVGSFHDAFGYYPGSEYVNRGPAYPATDRQWVTKQWDASTNVPATALYGIKAPGYTANMPFRFRCSKITSGANTGRLSCYWYGANVGLGYNGGTGNPGDIMAQYGWHVQILSQTDAMATVKIWNAQKDANQTFTADKATVSTNDVVRYTYNLVENWGSPLELFACVPLDTSRVEYVAGSGTGGAVPLPMSCSAAAAALAEGAQALAQAAADRSAEAVGWTGSVPTTGQAGFSFQVKVKAISGALSQSVALYDGGAEWKTLQAADVTVTPPTEFPNTVTTTFIPTDDAYIAKGLPNNNYGGIPLMYVGANDILRSLLKFDLVGIDPIFPVDSAVLRVYVNAYTGGGSAADLQAFRVMTPWVEGTVTWKTPWSIVGGDYAEPAAGSAAIVKTDVGTWKELDVTALVQQWTANPASNLGVILRLQNPTSYTTYRLATSEYWFSQFRPQLVVTYRTP